MGQPACQRVSFDGALIDEVAVVERDLAIDEGTDRLAGASVSGKAELAAAASASANRCGELARGSDRSMRTPQHVLPASQVCRPFQFGLDKPYGEISGSMT